MRQTIFDVAEFKALDGEQKGTFEALVSVYKNVDLQGEKVMPGAFKRTLEEWSKSGDPIPVIWSHEWGNPHAHIGSVKAQDIRDGGKGLTVVGRLDLDNPFAAQVYRLMAERRVKEFSFGYRVAKDRIKDDARELLDLDLIEIGPTLKGANESTELLGVKSALEDAAEEVGAKSPPWHIESDNADCDGFAVVVNETSEVVGCHDSREAAERHMAALYANESSAPEEEFEGKAGRRISKATANELRSIRDRIDALLGDEEPEDEPKSVNPAASQEPSPADETTRILLELEQMMEGSDGRAVRD